MSGINKVILVGHVGKDPEVKNVGGVEIATFSVATSKSWKDESGEKKEKTNWTDIVAFRNKAAFVANYVTKGRQVYVEGELQTRSWDDEKTGTKKYRTEVIAHTIELMGAKPKAEVSETNVAHDNGQIGRAHV